MSPIRVGSRLDQLVALRARVDLEIECERRQQQPTVPAAPRPPAPATIRQTATELSRADAQTVLARLGVTSAEVRRWALAHGVVDTLARGPLPGHVVAAYAAQDVTG